MIRKSLIALLLGATLAGAVASTYAQEAPAPKPESPDQEAPTPKPESPDLRA